MAVKAGVRVRFGLALLLSTTAACRSVGAPPAPGVAPIRCVSSGEIRTLREMPEPNKPSGNAAFDDETELDRPCDPSSDEAKAAKAAVSTIRGRLWDLPLGADPKAVTEELHGLLATRCFALSMSEPVSRPKFETVLAMRTWWESGGEDWLEHFVDLATTKRVVIPPTSRKALTAEKNDRHPLAPLLCSAESVTTAGACGHETNGWRKRADSALETRGRANHTAKTEEECATEAKKTDAEDRYDELRQCLEDLPARRAALPLGRYKAPKEGYLVVTGGSDSWRCKTIRTYDLATGAAYVASDCPRRSAGPPVEVKVGRVPLAAIREAAWMMMLSGVAETDVQVDSVSYDVPAEIAIERRASAVRGTSISLRCGHGGQIRSWSWMRADGSSLRGQVSGQMRWPNGGSEAEGHAAELLAIAEEAFEAGCAPSPAPASLPWDNPGPNVRESGVKASFDDPALVPVRAALATAKSVAGACPKLP